MGFKKISRNFLLVVNSLFILASVGSIIGSVILYFLGAQYDISQTISLGFLGISVASGLLSVGGFVSTWKRSKVGLWSYFIALILILSCQVGIIIVALFFKDLTNEMLNRVWHNELSDMSKNLIQHNFNCCGFSDALDSPGSSCPVVEVGCLEAMLDVIEEYSLYSYVIVGVLLLLKLIIIITIILMNSVYYINDRIDIEMISLHRNSQVIIMDNTIFRDQNNVQNIPSESL